MINPARKPKCPHCHKPVSYDMARGSNEHNRCPHCNGKIICSKPIYPPGPWYWDKRE
jgi:DNA-directed RNA polymerase subunit RPC12/RpoP